MAYIDYSYYFINYKGVLIDDEDTFARLSERASDMIDQITGYRIQNIGFDVFHERIRENIKKATAAQVEFLHLNGGADSIHGSNGVTEASIGSFSYTESTDAKETSAAVLNYLRFTGLLHKGVGVRG